MIKSEPRVIINEGSPVLTTIMPFKNPNNKTINRVINAANGIDISALRVNKVTVMPENPIIEPIDKSNSPLIISKVTPIARIPISDETCKYDLAPESDKKASWPKIEKKNHTNTRPANAPLSGRLIIFLKDTIWYLSFSVLRFVGHFLLL